MDGLTDRSGLDYARIRERSMFKLYVNLYSHDMTSKGTDTY